MTTVLALVSLLLALLPGAPAASPRLNASLTFDPETITNLTSDQERLVTVSLTLSGARPTDVFRVTASVGNLLVFSIAELNETWVGNGSWEVTFGMVVRGRRLGESEVTFTLEPRSGDKVVLEPTFDVIVLRESTIHEVIFRVITTTLVVLIILLMGCDIDPKIIFSYVKRPFAPAIGFVSQFVLMPLLAFGISHAIPLDKAFGFGLLTIGCSPGGGGSNVWTVLLHGDLNLSITMTFISSVCALGMMPLWLFILGRFYIKGAAEVPYQMVAINMLQVVLPCVAGMLLRHFKESIALKLRKAIRPMSLLFVIYIITYGTYANLYMYQVMGDYPITIPAGALLPWAGFMFGCVLGWLARQPRKRWITIGLETGIQNIGIAILILLYSMPKPLGDLAAVEPIVVAIFTPMPLYFILLGLTIRRCVKQRRSKVTLDPDEAPNVKEGVVNVSFDDLSEKGKAMKEEEKKEKAKEEEKKEKAKEEEKKKEEAL